MPPSPLFDDHVHSRLSIDGRDSVLDLCRAAAEKGLAGLCITDHFDTEPSDPGYGRYDLDQLQGDVRRARQDCGRLAILVGAEVCYQAPFAPRVADFLQASPLDFVLGSAHYARHEFVEPAFFARHGAAEGYQAYLRTVEEVVASGLFDSLGHLDLAKRHATALYGPFDPHSCWAQVERILRLLVERGMALEINTSGWRQDPGEPYPGEAILRRYRELGGTRITIGSDAHHVGRVGDGLERAHDLARQAGFTHLTRFVQRRPQFIPL